MDSMSTKIKSLLILISSFFILSSCQSENIPTINAYVNFCETMSELPSKNRLEYANTFAEAELLKAGVKNVDNYLPHFRLAVAAANLAVSFIETEEVVQEFYSGNQSLDKANQLQKEKLFAAECLSELRETDFKKDKEDTKKETKDPAYDSIKITYGDYVQKTEWIDEKVINYLCYFNGIELSKNVFLSKESKTIATIKDGYDFIEGEDNREIIKKDYPNCYDEFFQSYTHGWELKHTLDLNQ